MILTRARPRCGLPANEVFASERIPGSGILPGRTTCPDNLARRLRGLPAGDRLFTPPSSNDATPVSRLTCATVAMSGRDLTRGTALPFSLAVADVDVRTSTCHWLWGLPVLLFSSSSNCRMTSRFFKEATQGANLIVA